LAWICLVQLPDPTLGSVQTVPPAEVGLHLRTLLFSFIFIDRITPLCLELGHPADTLVPLLRSRSFLVAERREDPCALVGRFRCGLIRFHEPPFPIFFVVSGVFIAAFIRTFSFHQGLCSRFRAASLLSESLGASHTSLLDIDQQNTWGVGIVAYFSSSKGSAVRDLVETSGEVQVVQATALNTAAGLSIGTSESSESSSRHFLSFLLKNLQLGH
jgi:hypothetical protein